MGNVGFSKGKKIVFLLCQHQSARGILIWALSSFFMFYLMGLEIMGCILRNIVLFKKFCIKKKWKWTLKHCSPLGVCHSERKMGIVRPDAFLGRGWTALPPLLISLLWAVWLNCVKGTSKVKPKKDWTCVLKLTEMRL